MKLGQNDTGRHEHDGEEDVSFQKHFSEKNSNKIKHNETELQNRKPNDQNI
jgi:hypothetical protein